MKPGPDPLAGLALLALAAAPGVGTRRFTRSLPAFVAAYAGDTLRALAACLGLGLLLPRASTKPIAALAIGVSLAVEVSQLYHAPWIDSTRRTNPGGLVLGHGFVWSDPICDAVGAGIGIRIDRAGKVLIPGRRPPDGRATGGPPRPA